MVVHQVAAEVAQINLAESEIFRIEIYTLNSKKKKKEKILRKMDKTCGYKSNKLLAGHLLSLIDPQDTLHF